MICVDASIAVKWVLVEADSPAALNLYARNRDTGIIAPAFMAIEVTNAIWRRVSRGLLTLSAAEDALDHFLDFVVDLAVSDDLHLQAIRLAHRFSRPAVYDMHYVALAQITGCELWTADQSLLNALAGSLPFVRPLTPT